MFLHANVEMSLKMLGRQVLLPSKQEWMISASMVLDEHLGEEVRRQRDLHVDAQGRLLGLRRYERVEALAI